MNRTFLAATAIAVVVPFAPGAAQTPAGGQPAVADSGTTGGGGNAATRRPDSRLGPAGASRYRPGDRRHRCPPRGRRRAWRRLGLDEEELQHDIRPSIGETLAGQPGVTASSFGPTASRPILRGLQGDRVRILTDGIGTLDLSSSDPDHAGRDQPAHRRAHRGAARPVGAAVRLVGDRRRRQRHRHPHPAHASRPERSGVNALAEYGTAANERSVNGSVDVPIGGHFVVHADGAYSKYRRPSHRRLRPVEGSARGSARQPRSGHPRARRPQGQAAQHRGPDRRSRAAASLMSTATSTSASRSATTRSNTAFRSASRSIRRSKPKQPTSTRRQTRDDARADIPLGGFFKVFEFRGGIRNITMTSSRTTARSARASSATAARCAPISSRPSDGGWGGTSGVQYLQRRRPIRGDEKFLPDSTSRQLGLFTLQIAASAARSASKAAPRVEFAQLNADADAADRGQLAALIGSAPFSQLHARLGLARRQL